MIIVLVMSFSLTHYLGIQLVKSLMDIDCKWAAPSEKVFFEHTQNSTRACAKSHPGIFYPLVRSVDSHDSVSG